MNEYQILFARSAVKELEALPRSSQSRSWRVSKVSRSIPGLEDAKNSKAPRACGGYAKEITASYIPSMMTAESWTSLRYAIGGMPIGNAIACLDPGRQGNATHFVSQFGPQSPFS